MSMTPQEHYDEAERLLDAALKGFDVFGDSVTNKGITTHGEVDSSINIVNTITALAQVHATLAAGPRVTNNHYTSYSSPGALA